jgi:hypothetical protein
VTKATLGYGGSSENGIFNAWFMEGVQSGQAPTTAFTVVQKGVVDAFPLKN